MRHALALARRALGQTAPNPAVGCVIAGKDGRILGRGVTGRGGRPHGEAIALGQAGLEAKGATVYVTLEPCSHHGETPPCADALIEARISRAVVAVGDPDPRVNGRGLARLREAGIEVVTGILEEEAAALNAGFFSRLTKQRPMVTLKLAMSLDGKIASGGGESRWITGVDARAYGHLLRAKHDAILIGAGTAKADDPELTCRLPGLKDRTPVRVVLDSRLQLSAWSKLARTAAENAVLLFTGSDEPGAALQACGVEICRVRRDARGRPDVDAVLAELAKRGITRLLVEGGASVHASFLDRGAADRLELFRGVLMLGGAGRDGIDPLLAMALTEAPRFRIEEVRRLGADLLESYGREGA